MRLYNLIKHIGQRHTVTLICEKRPNQTREDQNEVEKICDQVITVARQKQWSLKNIIKTGFSLSPFLIIGHTTQDMRVVIEKELVKKKYDLIHVETFYVMQNLPKTSLPIVLVEHNIEYFIYERYAQKAAWFMRPLLMLDVYKLKRAEQRAWEKATVVAAVSKQDKEVIGRKNTYIVPNGVDTTVFQPKMISSEFKTKKKKILYIGDYGYVQNRDAAGYIINSIWPQLKKNISLDATLWIVGKNMNQSIKDLGKEDNNIFFDDTNVQTAADIFSEADVLLAPIRIGGGTSYKIIEAMAVGTPVVTTSLGHEGIEAKPDEEILIADTPEAIAGAVVSLLTNQQQYTLLSKNARKAIEKNYDWVQISRSLEYVYREAIRV